LLDRLARAVIGPPCGPSHERTDAGQKFAHADRLRHIIVGAVDEREHLVGLRGGQGNDDNRGIGVAGSLPNRAAERDTVEPGEPCIEHDQVEALFRDALERIAAVVAFPDVEAFASEMVRDQQARWRV
jgi:hypothetical protein